MTWRSTEAVLRGSWGQGRLGRMSRDPGRKPSPLCRAGLLLALVLGACEGDAQVPGGEPPPPAEPAVTAIGPGRWESLPPMPSPPRFYVGVAAARGKLFVVGGSREPTEVLAHAFDTATGTWEALPPLPTPTAMANAVGVGDRLFVLGGLANARAVEYDFDARAWQPRAPQPVPLGHGSAALGVHGNTVLLAGGLLPGPSPNNLNTGQRVRELLAYDVTRDAWEVWPELPVAAGYSMGAVVGDRFFVIGGSYFARTDEVLVFDVKARTWDTGTPLPMTLSSAAAGVIGGKIVLTGGIASTTGMINDQTLTFDPARPEAGWTAVSPLITPRFATGGAVIGNRLYVPTGMGNGPGGALDFRALPELEVFIPGP
jgi:hypothetical protein